MENGLLKTPAGERYWNFYEWADGLDGGWTFDTPFENGITERFDAPLNLFFCMALEAGVKLAVWTGNREAEAQFGHCLAELRYSIHEAFWDDVGQVYKNYAGNHGDRRYAELTQSLALCSRVAPDNIAQKLRKKLSEKDNSLVRTTLSYAIYKYEALLQEADKYGAVVFDDIADDWGHMLYNKATSFWETIKGADDFEKAGSLCHGWSAIPAYFFQAYILGIKPLLPGFRQFTANPATQAANIYSGCVPTPYGDITVHCDIDGGKTEYTVTFPDGTERII